MSKCGGAGLCGRGSERCLDAQRWWVFCVQWKYIAWEMVEARNEMVDATIDFEREER